MNGWWYFGCQRAGTCVMWSPRVYPFIHCKGSIEGTRRIMAFTTPHRNTKLLAWYPAWQVPLGLHRILNLSMIKDRRWSYHTTRILRVHLPQLLGWEQNVDVPIPLSVDTLAWTSTVLPQTGVETTDLVLRMRQEEVIRSSHLISHTYVKVRDKGGDKIWATPYIFEHKICAHTWTHWVANNSHKSGCNLSPSASRYGYATELRIHTWGGEGVSIHTTVALLHATCTDHGLPHPSLKNHAPQAWSAWASKGDEEEPTCKHLWSLRIPEYFHAWGKLTPYSVNTR